MKKTICALTKIIIKNFEKFHNFHERSSSIDHLSNNFFFYNDIMNKREPNIQICDIQVFSFVY